MRDGSTHAPNPARATVGFEGGVTTPEHGSTGPDRVDSEVFDVLFGGEREEWPEQSSSKGFRAPWPVTILVALLLAVGGLGLGAFLQRQRPTAATSATSTAFAQFASAGFGARTRAGTTGTSSATKNITSGTVTDIIGRTLYLTDSSGALVPVRISSSTIIDRNSSSSLSGLKPGDTVTVQGSTQKNGTVQAASVSATAKGLSSLSAGGFLGGLAGNGTSSAANGG